MLVDQEVAAVAAGEGPAGDGLTLRIGGEVGGQDEGWVPVLPDADRRSWPDTTAPSFRSVTVTVTASSPVLLWLSLASTVTRYSLASAPEPEGRSKSGGDAKARTPLPLLSVVMVKSPASKPPRSHVNSSPSGSVAR